MFDFWFELPPILRAGLGILLMVVAGVIWFASGGTLYAIGLAVVGLVFLLFCKAGDSGGYNF
jgi:hypothetical protein